MPKVNKVLHGSVDTIAQKLKHGIVSVGTHVCLRDSWDSEADGKKCIVQIYEKLSLMTGSPHYSMTVALFDAGEEIRLFAATAGGSNKHFGNPYPEGEGELIAILNTVLDVLDDIIV